MIFVFAWCKVCGLPVGCLLISMHPMKKANRGGTAPYWLGAAQLKAGGSCPVGLEGPSRRRERPLALHSTPIEQ